MRSFSKNEKKIIDRLLELSESDSNNSNTTGTAVTAKCCLKNLLTDIPSGIIGTPTNYNFDFSIENKVSVHVKKPESQKDDAIDFERNQLVYLTSKLYEIVILLEYFKQEGFMYCLKEEIHNSKHAKETDLSKNENFNAIELSEDLQKKLYDLSQFIFIPMPKLKELKEHDYKDFEKYKFDLEHMQIVKTTNATKIAAFASLAGVIVTAIIGFFSYNQNSQTTKVEIQNTPLPIEINEKEEQSAQTETEPKVEEVPTVNVLVQEENTQKVDEETESGAEKQPIETPPTVTDQKNR